MDTFCLETPECEVYFNPAHIVLVNKENKMSKLESTRRELFKEWFDSLVWPMCEKCIKSEYIAWEAFNAALDCVEIELPQAYYMEAGDGPGVYPQQDKDGIWIDKDDTITSISNLNLGLKIK
jgi:hypothetical protein